MSKTDSWGEPEPREQRSSSYQGTRVVEERRITRKLTEPSRPARGRGPRPDVSGAKYACQLSSSSVRPYEDKAHETHVSVIAIPSRRVAAPRLMDMEGARQRELSSKTKATCHERACHEETFQR